MQFSPPEPPPKTEAAALAALRAQASVTVRRLDPAEQAALFIRLRQQYDAFARNVQSMFWSAAEDVLRDPQSGAAAHRAARNFLIFASGGTYYEDQLDALERSGAPSSGN